MNTVRIFAWLFIFKGDQPLSSEPIKEYWNGEQRIIIWISVILKSLSSMTTWLKNSLKIRLPFRLILFFRNICIFTTDMEKLAIKIRFITKLQEIKLKSVKTIIFTVFYWLRLAIIKTFELLTFFEIFFVFKVLFASMMLFHVLWEISRLAYYPKTSSTCAKTYIPICLTASFHQVWPWPHFICKPSPLKAISVFLLRFCTKRILRNLLFLNCCYFAYLDMYEFLVFEIHEGHMETSPDTASSRWNNYSVTSTDIEPIKRGASIWLKFIWS